MPATEQTWRDNRLMHVIFGVTSLAMLITTIWMLAADHVREWKGYQRTFRDVETWTTQARMNEQLDTQYRQELARRQAAIDEAQRQVPPPELIEKSKQLVISDYRRREVAEPDLSKLDRTYQALKSAPAEEKKAQRTALLAELGRFIREARFREDNLLVEKKMATANFDVARSKYEIAVGENDSSQELDHLQKNVDDVKAKVDALTLRVQDASVYRKDLERLVAQMTADEAKAKKAYEEQQLAEKRLDTTIFERHRGWQERLLELPIIDAFGRPLKVEQIWLPKLTINNNFRDVARFDRCTTCHQGIDKTAPGSPIEPAYRPEEMLTLTLSTPALKQIDSNAPSAAKADESDDTEESKKVKQLSDEVNKIRANESLDSRTKNEQLLEKVYGLQLAARGLLDPNDVTISVVRPETRGAQATLAPGDVILQINEVKILGRDHALTYLVDQVKWGLPLNLTVRRGLPHPYVTHPRLDLFVGSLSPHKSADIGCTICHDGQGSATDFKWASHTPSSPRQANDWKREHGWFNNHHWSFPMYPHRFAESTCLKCHHEVAELEPSDRFPDPPAPKLVEGYNTVRQYGCFGCHEINGFDGPNRRIGPDMRAEPNYSAAAQALLTEKELTDEQRRWVTEIAAQPENDSSRHSFLESVRAAEPDKVSANVRRLATILEDVETPGRLRKVGPSLRHVGSKVDYDFLYSWIRRPRDFRPDTRMPQFFGLHEHLEPGSDGLAQSQKFEPIEIRGAAEYLLAKSQPFEFLDQPQGISEQPSAERGKKLFQTRGCLACHQHADFPDAKMNQGPNLTNVGGKLGRENNTDGGKWLYSWLRNPSRYHPRTLMPNLILEPLKDQDGKTSDPAADIAVYLLGSQAWKPENVPARELSDDEKKSLYDLALLHLKDKFPTKQAERFLKEGIPEDRAAEVKGDEIELLGKDKMTPEKQLVYVGRRTISKYGCSGCHDIPGFEDAKPIGTGLADWGRKGTDKLAFEQITTYLTQGHGTAAAHSATGEQSDTRAQAPAADRQNSPAPSPNLGGSHAMNFEDMDPSSGFFMESLLGHERPGFIWQKLRAPRSYDFKKTENKGYNERLRMPKFNLGDEQIESVITFVLGLVAEPPAPQYVYKPSPRRQALAEGLKIVEKYNCTGCHTLKMDQWKLAYQAGDLQDPSEVNDYDFLQPHFTPQEVKASLATDMRGLRHATLTGMPQMSETTGKPARRDADGALIEEDDSTTKAYYLFSPWQNALINGKPLQAGVQNLLVPESAIEKQYPALGGYLPRLIYPAVIADEKLVNPNAKPEEAWGWLPPPLVREGRKVQTAWLHDFLLDPYPIRPATVLRMPKFNMSSAEASSLVNYFSAEDGAEYPYDFDPRTRDSHLESAETQHPNRLSDALKIVTDNNYCIKCHLLGDFEPAGSERAKAPRLDQVYKRMRPGYLEPWLANPKRLLPYTGMPVNIPPDTPVSQALFKGTSREQLQGVVDLLLNYDRFSGSRTSIKPLIKDQPPANQAAGGPDNSAAAAVR